MAASVTIRTPVARGPTRWGRAALAVALLVSGTIAGQVAMADAHSRQQPVQHDLNVLPERFEDRLLFPVEEQAVAMARRGLELPQTDADLSRGALAGVQSSAGPVAS